VRAAALIALPNVPSLGEGLPPTGPPLAVLHLARFDPSESNADAAAALWEDAGCELPGENGEEDGSWFVGALAAHLASPHADVRGAAAAALAAAVEAAPGRVGAALDAVVALYASGEEEARGGGKGGGSGGGGGGDAAAEAGGKGGRGGFEVEERKLQVGGAGFVRLVTRAA
jgi:hypothetical protein